MHKPPVINDLCGVPVPLGDSRARVVPTFFRPIAHAGSFGEWLERLASARIDSLPASPRNRLPENPESPWLVSMGEACVTPASPARPDASRADFRQHGVHAVRFPNDPPEAVAPAPVPGSVVPFCGLDGAMAQ